MAGFQDQGSQSILTAGLGVGDRTDAFDPVVPIGSVVSQDPRSGLQVPKSTAVNYVVSKGPEPTPSPSPTESPSPSPPSPTPVAIAQPVAVAEPLAVGDAEPDT